MFEGIPVSALSGVTGWTLAGALFILMMVGKIVSVRTVEREANLRQQYIDRLEKEADRWHTAYETKSAQLSSILKEYDRTHPMGPAA